MASVLATIVTSKSSQVTRIPNPLVIQPDAEISIGRGPKCDIVYGDAKSVSHVHCRIRNGSQGVQIKDVSSNKTWLDGKPLDKNTWVDVADGANVVLSHDPKVKFEVRVGSEAATSKKRRTSSKPQSGSIAVIRSWKHSELEYCVIPEAFHSNEVSVRIGRAKNCEIRIDDKKVSSTHCKVTFHREEGESIHWSVKIESISKNKTYIGSELVEDRKHIESFVDAVKIALVFPIGEKPVDILTLEPVMVDSTPESDEPMTAAEMIQQELAKEEKRRKKDIYMLEKQSKEWEVKYKQEIERMQTLEHSLMIEIEQVEKRIASKRKDNETLSDIVQSIEKIMHAEDLKFKSDIETLKKDHERRLADYTAEVAQVSAMYQKLYDEKLKLQMGLS
jgi:pSer/pThr/pTyr-binding forkhead associated (FHA) protein/uncharacterized protein YeeX (DUF496 family)